MCINMIKECYSLVTHVLIYFYLLTYYRQYQCYQYIAAVTVTDVIIAYQPLEGHVTRDYDPLVDFRVKPLL